MDSLTQIALGAAIGELVAGRRLGYKAALLGGIVATIPDLDVLFSLVLDPVDYLHIHRGFTHSLFFSALLAPLLALLAQRIHRQKSQMTFKSWFTLFYLVLLTHPILDLFTGYGTQFLYPITDHAFEFNTIFIIDPIYTLPLLTCLVLALRLPRNNAKRTKYTQIGLTVSTAYLLLTVVLKLAAIPAFKAELDRQNIQYERMMTVPGPFNSLLWRALVETEHGFYQGTYSLFDTSENLIRFTFLPRNAHKIEDIKNSSAIQRLLWFSKGYYHINERDGELYFNDLRFGSYNSWMGDHSSFIFAFRIDETLTGDVAFEQVSLPVDIQWQDFRMLFARTLGLIHYNSANNLHQPAVSNNEHSLQDSLLSY
jgi:inner membrane protein